VVDVYRAELVPLWSEAAALLRAGQVDIVLLASARTAVHFAAECDRLGLARSGIAIAAISPAVAEAAGPGWRSAAIAVQPDEAALLAAAGLTCDKGA
jgi:uroporphyrinogen-III synthase